jgi:hypothetical protein
MCNFSATEALMLAKKCFPNFDVYLQMREKDISNIADDYGDLTTAQPHAAMSVKALCIGCKK